jgi:hypothetical protein
MPKYALLGAQLLVAILAELAREAAFLLIADTNPIANR